MGNKQAILVVGLGFGDEGKGSLVDYLVRRYNAHTVVRYNGGAQAAHNVIDPSGKHHTFAQFGSGTFHPGTRTYLSRYMMVEPMSLLTEEKHLRTLGITDALDRMAIDRQALITTPYHQAANRLREMARGNTRHGSCGRGIGETMSDYLTYGDQVLFAGDLAERAIVMKKLKFLREAKWAELLDTITNLPKTEAVQREISVLTDPEFDAFCTDRYQTFAQQVAIVDESYWRDRQSADGTIIFEGAQGVLLDENFGFHPYTTWSTTTLHNAQQLLREAGYDGEVIRLGVLRAYATRHGPGPFVTEDPQLTAILPDAHNGMNAWQRAFRVGHLDLVMTRYALDITAPIDGLAITHLDRLPQLSKWCICQAYISDDNKNSEIAHYFDRGEDGKLVRIKVNPTIDLNYQACLTHWLSRCRPHYTHFTPQLVHLDWIVAQLGIPLAIASFGPQAGDKRLWNPTGLTRPLA